MADNLGTAAYKLVLDARDFQSNAAMTGKQIRAVQDVMRQTTTPAEKMAKNFDQVKAAFEAGQIPAKNYQRYIDQINAAANRNQQAVVSMRDGINSANQSLLSGVPVVGKYLGQLGKIHPTVLAATAGIGLLSAAAVGTLYRVRQEMLELDEVGKRSRALGFDPDEMLSLQYAAERAAGVSAEKFGTAMTRINHATHQAAAGVGEAGRAFERLGLSSEKMAATSPAERIRLISDAFAGIPDASTRASIAMELFGRGGADMANFLSLGSEQMDILTEKWERLTGLKGIDTRDIERANDAMADLSLAWKSLFTRMAVDNAGDMAVVFERLAEAAAKARGEGAEDGEAQQQRMIPWLADMFQIVRDPASRWWTQGKELMSHGGDMLGEAFSGNFRETVDANQRLAMASIESFTTKNPLWAWYDLVSGKVRSDGEKIQDATDAAAARASSRVAQDALTDTDIEAIDPTEAIEAAQKRIEAIENLADTYRDQVETYGMAAREAQLYRMERDAVTDADWQAIDAARALATQLDELEEAEKRRQERIKEYATALRDLDRELERAEKDRERVFQQAAKSMERFKTPEEKYIDTVQELMEWLDMGAISLADFTRAKQSAADEIGKDIKLGKLVTVEEGEQWGATTMRDWRANQLARRQTAIDTESLDTQAMIQRFDQGRQWADAQPMGMSPEESFRRAIEGVIAELPEDEEESNRILEQIAANTRAMREDPGRVKIAGGF